KKIISVWNLILTLLSESLHRGSNIQHLCLTIYTHSGRDLVSILAFWLRSSVVSVLISVITGIGSSNQSINYSYL
ncbi:hypothetical protein DFH28DRAFT_961995, partial [Melampsora americana]